MKPWLMWIKKIMAFSWKKAMQRNEANLNRRIKILEKQNNGASVIAMKARLLIIKRKIQEMKA